MEPVLRAKVLAKESVSKKLEDVGARKEKVVCASHWLTMWQKTNRHAHSSTLASCALVHDPVLIASISYLRRQKCGRRKATITR